MAQSACFQLNLTSGKLKVDEELQEGGGRYNHRGSGIQISIRAQNKTEEFVGKDYRLMIMRG